MSPAPPPDNAARHTAVHGLSSYIVQAPAGSGKTELLVSRYLHLLATVRRPEAILAITFTNKAAAEMRNRILAALDAANGPRPTEPHRAEAYALAQRAAAADAAHGWRLRESPRRLRVQTIDSLCAELNRQMPLLSGLGAPPTTLERAAPLYDQAVEQVLAEIEETTFGDHVATVLGHLGGSAGRLIRLLVAELGRRDQWIRHVVRGESAERAELEGALDRLVSAELARARDQIPMSLLAELTEHGARCAALRTACLDDPGALATLVECTQPPAATSCALPVWHALAAFALKADGAVRARLTVKEGVPGKTHAKGKTQATEFAAHKDAVMAVLERLRTDEAATQALARAAKLPLPVYTDAQWSALSALLRVLKLAVAHLKVICASTGQIDFAEVQSRALLALGHAEAPTELMLALDHRLEHILVDEFQDTSHGQMQLLQQLTAGWSQGDGRTLFVVGDPMQSIYRFREAEVGYFIQARAHGIGEVALEPLTLQANFRSRAPIVEWVNGCFSRVFPTLDDPGAGAVSYAPAVAVVEASSADQEEGDADAATPGASLTDGVHIHAQIGDDRATEAKTVADLVKAALVESDSSRIAILVRARSHLSSLVPALREAGVRFRAVDAERLTQRAVVQDLYSLTRALLHGADAVAWLGVLRAPWCGLTLRDLQPLFAGREPWQQVLAGHCAAAGMDPAARERLNRVLTLTHAARAERRTRSLRETVEALWYALGGPQLLDNSSDLTDARTYLDLLRRHELASELGRRVDFERALDGLYAAPDAGAGNRVQVMTMHKAKGLEFDVVILPNLGRIARGDDKPLLHSLEVARAGGDADLLLAPIEAPGATDPLFTYLAGLERARVDHETLRLLYVAATRARARLHLIAHAERNDEDGELIAPKSGSLLAKLWPVVEPAFDAASTREHEPPADAAPVAAPPPLLRAPASWTPSPPTPGVHAPDAELPALVAGDVELEFEWVGESARHVGTLVHRWLERFARDGLREWTQERLAAQEQRFRAGLANLGVPAFELARATQRVLEALMNVLADERAEWLLATRPDAGTELALATFREGAAARFVVDRTFVDEDGVRWIVDYKTGSHEGGDVEAFLDTEQERYQAQLENYARLLNEMEPRETRLGLYFPLIGAWREWPARRSTT